MQIFMSGMGSLLGLSIRSCSCWYWWCQLGGDEYHAILLLVSVLVLPAGNEYHVVLLLVLVLGVVLLLVLVIVLVLVLVLPFWV